MKANHSLRRNSTSREQRRNGDLGFEINFGHFGEPKVASPRFILDGVKA